MIMCQEYLRHYHQVLIFLGNLFFKNFQLRLPVTWLRLSFAESCVCTAMQKFDFSRSLAYHPHENNINDEEL